MLRKKTIYKTYKHGLLNSAYEYIYEYKHVH
jgi:hypothetical protein